MAQITDYKIVSGRGWSADKAAASATQQVREDIAEGWQPLGSPSVLSLAEGIPPEPFFYYEQAMVRYE